MNIENDLEAWQKVESEMKSHNQWLFLFSNPEGEQGMITCIKSDKIIKILKATIVILEHEQFDKEYL